MWEHLWELPPGWETFTNGKGGWREDEELVEAFWSPMGNFIWLGAPENVGRLQAYGREFVLGAFKVEIEAWAQKLERSVGTKGGDLRVWEEAELMGESSSFLGLLRWE